MQILTRILTALVLCSAAAIAQPQISYIMPDIGAPGMNTYVEIIARADAPGAFGADGFYSNTPTSAVRVEADTAKVIVGPVVVSWNGRLISTQVFVRPTASFGIIALTITSPLGSANVNFEIVAPQSLGTLTANGALGSGGAYGTRSRRGAMIVDRLTLGGSPGTTYSVSTTDPDNSSNGNQGYLPFILISKGPITIQSGVILNVNGSTPDAGPGGGGGGGQVCDANFVGGGSSGTSGGAGFTGGGGGGRNNAGSIGGSSIFQPNGQSSGVDGSGMNTVAGGQGKIPGCNNPEASGGGTGHPFGKGGDGWCGGNSIGQYGGGGSGGQNATGGGGGYGQNGGTGSGTDASQNRGNSHGNEQGIPLAGGSGGGSGNPQKSGGGCAGKGGGGGGAFAFYSMEAFNNSGILQANGGNGESLSPGGGGGSGGFILLGSKNIGFGGSNNSVAGGNGGSNGGNGAPGRGRYDGFVNDNVIQAPTFSPATASVYSGLSIDTLTYTATPTFTLRGSRAANADIQIYWRHSTTAWAALPAPTYAGPSGRRWFIDVTLPGMPGEYFFCALQKVNSPATGTWNDEPDLVMSQVAANIVTLPAVPKIEADAPPALGVYQGCPGEDPIVDSATVTNRGTSDLIVTPSIIGVNMTDFTILPNTNPITIPPGQTRKIAIRFLPASPGSKQATLVLTSNDPINPVVELLISGTRPIIEPRFDDSIIDFGKVCKDSVVTVTRWFYFKGTVPHNIDPIARITPSRPSPFSLLNPIGRTFLDKPLSDNVNDSVAITIRFRPTAAGVFVDTFKIRSSPCPLDLNLIVRGEGIDTRVTVTPPTLDYNSVPVNNSKKLPFTIVSTGDSPVRIQQLVLVDPTMPFVLPSGPIGQILPMKRDSLVDSVEFIPTEEGYFRTTMLVIIDGPCFDTIRVTLQGRGVKESLVFSRNPITLAADSCSRVSVIPPIVDTLLLTNNGSIPVDVISVVVESAKVTVQTTPVVTPPGGVRLNNGDEIEFTVSWQPGSPAGTGTERILVTTRNSLTGELKVDTIIVILKLERAQIGLFTFGGEIPTQLLLEPTYGCGPIKDTLLLINTGTLGGEVEGGLLSGENFTINPQPPFFMNSGDSVYLEIVFDPPVVGDYRDSIVLFSGLCDDILFAVDLQGSRYERDYQYSGIPFGLTNINLGRSGRALFQNNTVAPDSEKVVINEIYVRPPALATNFTILSPTLFPVLVGLGEKIEPEVRFTPDQEIPYNAELCFVITYPCLDTICVPLTGEGIFSNIFVDPNLLNFGSKYFCEEDTLEVTIISVGPDPLTLRGLEIVGNNPAAFEIISPPSTPQILRPGVPQPLDSITLRIRFIPGNDAPDGPKDATLRIISDDINQDTVLVSLIGVRATPEIIATPSSISFGTVIVGVTASQQVTLQNTSADTITIDQFDLRFPFLLDMSAPLVIPPGESRVVTVSFKPENSGVVQDSLTAFFNFPCAGETKIYLDGEGLRGATTIVIPTTITGEPGMNISIPIVLEGSSSTAEVGATTFETVVRFDKTMLYPTGVRVKGSGTPKLNGIAASSSATILDNTTDVNDRILTMQFVNNPVPDAPDTLGYLDATVLLGKALQTPITIDTLYWTDGSVEVVTTDGMFELMGYCDIGGDRLIEAGDFGIKSVVPNPFNPSTHIVFATVEDGESSLVIHDASGRTVATLIDAERLPTGAHAIKWDAEGIPSGIYYAILITPTQRSVQRLVLLK